MKFHPRLSTAKTDFSSLPMSQQMPPAPPNVGATNLFAEIVPEDEIY